MEHHHVADLLGRLERPRPLGLRLDAEGAELEAGRALPDPEVDAAVGQEIQGRGAFGGARGVVVVRDHLADAVPEPDPGGAGGGGGEEDLRRRRMGVLVEEMVLDLPGVVEAEPVRENHLVERLLEEAVLVALPPRLGQLQLVEDPEAHADRPDCVVPSPEISPAFCCGRQSARCGKAYSLKTLRRRGGYAFSVSRSVRLATAAS